MPGRDISEPLKEQDEGWIAIDEDNNVVESAKTFEELAKKVEKLKKKVVIVPVAEEYSSLLTIFLHE
ncbi:hypothetical protein H3C70_04020 [Patescibacteria group bacterium]|nr:hypothetical protein [Patescibacteria group bacterium]